MPIRLFSILTVLALPVWLLAAESSDATKTSEEVERGHSLHGDFFNEGPRQHAYLMGGTGHVTFEVSSKHEEATAFVRQGLGQVYGFWYLEAERLFRHAIWLDSECAIAYWGAALATLHSTDRSKGFIAEAVKRKEQASERERMYIDGLDAYLKAKKGTDENRDEAYRKSLEEIILKYPADLDARALLALQLYKNRKNGNYLATEAFMQDILAEVPQHSVHHFRIHLWDHRKPELVLDSAANCGQGSPGIAHMWHMPGHIYSRLKRYADASWQQEASARVDHYHMMHDRLLPDQIHNYAHNNEWLIRNLNHVGRVSDAVALAKNMIELPRHPKYNTLKRGSSNYGRRRLIETLTQYELWDEAVALANSSYLEPTETSSEQLKRLRLLGIAQVQLGNPDAIEKTLSELESRLKKATSDRDETRQKAEAKRTEELLKKDSKKLAEAKQAAEKKVREQAKVEENAEEPAAAEQDSGEESGELDKQIEAAVAEATKRFKHELAEKEKKQIAKAGTDASRTQQTIVTETEKVIAAVNGYRAWSAGDATKALPLLQKAGGVDPMLLTKVQYATGEHDKALAAARKHVAANKNEVQPQAELVDLLWIAEKREEAAKELKVLQSIASSIEGQSPVFSRVDAIAAELKVETSWRAVAEPATDVGNRPPLDSLGPFRWKPSPAPAWQLPGSAGDTVSLEQFKGKPVVLIFFLGHGCLHCAEQLHKFAPMREAYLKQGIQLMAISSDSVAGLQKSIDDYKGEPLPIPLASDEENAVFKAYRAYDDFEEQPLHGTFLLDADGLVRWQDISYEPFMDPEFLLEEAQRLLGQQKLEATSQ